MLQAQTRPLQLPRPLLLALPKSSCQHKGRTQSQQRATSKSFSRSRALRSVRKLSPSVKVAAEGNQSLFILNCCSNPSSCSPPFTALCKIGKSETELYTLIDTCAQGGNYIHSETAQILADAEAMAVRTLDKPMKINGFNSKAALDITHTISVLLRVGRHQQPCCTFYIIDLG